MVDIPSHPTKGDAQAALGLLLGLLNEFPFVDEVSKSVALSAMMTPAVRAAISVAPLHAFTSPTPGSGKSYLVDVVSAIYSGKPCPVIGKGETNSELEKRLHTSLVAGHPIVNIDNVNGELGGDFLCQAIERPEIDIRILGETRHVRVQNNVTLFATGNNIRLTGDVTRRSTLCRLDTKLERPELRKFSTNPVNKVLANRGNYIAAALTIVRAYRCAGSPLPDATVPIGSFQGWSDFVRSPLMWLELADPLKSMEEVRSIDPELEHLKGMFAALAERFGYGPDKAQTAAKVLSAAYNGKADGALREAIDALRQKGRPVGSVELGQWLGRYQDRVVENMRLAKRPRGKRAAEWFIEDLSKP
jgi:putative DNA primase/helicase